MTKGPHRDRAVQQRTSTRSILHPPAVLTTEWAAGNIVPPAPDILFSLILSLATQIGGASRPKRPQEARQTAFRRHWVPVAAKT